MRSTIIGAEYCQILVHKVLFWHLTQFIIKLNFAPKKLSLQIKTEISFVFTCDSNQLLFSTDEKIRTVFFNQIGLQLLIMNDRVRLVISLICWQNFF